MPRGFIHIRRYGIVYARVPKVANSSIKTCLAQLVEVTPIEGLRPTNDRFWRECTGGESELLKTREYTERYAEFFSFSFVREPRDRLFSCYVNKIVANKAADGFEKRGYRADMSFDDFVVHTCALEVKAMDVHTQPQAFLIRDAQGRWPHFIGLLERVAEDWQRLQVILAERGVPDMGPLPVKNSRKEARAQVSTALSAEAKAAMMEVYGEGFELHARLAAGAVGHEQAPDPTDSSRRDTGGSDRVRD